MSRLVLLCLTAALIGPAAAGEHPHQTNRERAKQVATALKALPIDWSDQQANIDVRVDGSSVVLTGRVRTRFDAKKVSATIWEMPWVESVHIDLVKGTGAAIASTSPTPPPVAHGTSYPPPYGSYHVTTGYAWPSYSNYGQQGVQYPGVRWYSPQERVQLQWDDGHWQLHFKRKPVAAPRP